MPRVTIEKTYHLPIYQHGTYDAPSVEAACRQALEDDDWEHSKEDYDTPGQTYITGIWSGENAAYKGEAIPVPSNYDEAIQRKAAHFDTLIAVLSEAARPLGLSHADFDLWLPRAQAALAKADAIREGLPDPT